VSVGEALAKARSQAGLTVDELSERTRIRKTVIRCIEHDDYDACGGDVFVRGYLRAIAGAVGIDARPLISEYNRTREDTSRWRDTHITHVARIADQVPPAADPVPPATDPAATVADPSFPVPDAATTAADRQFPAADPDATAADLPVIDAGMGVIDAGLGATAADEPPASVPAADADADVTRFDLPYVSEDPAPTLSDLPVIPAEPAPPPMPWEPPRLEPRRSRRSQRSQRHRSGDGHRVARVAVPAALVLAVGGVIIGLAASGGSTPAGQNAALTQHSSHAAGGTLGAGKTSGKSTAKTSAPATPTTSPTPSPTTTAPGPVTSLHIAGVQAYGPQGLADGDNPQVAQSVISGGAQSPWSSQWYATPQFGNLKQGTGLLIDMGHPVTITSVRINLAGYGGANLQLRVGDPAGGPSGMKVAARADDVGGTVRMHLQTPQYVRYLLIWFTLLPPNGAGQYQATVYHVVVNGRT
jgi:hypothetical protein